MVNVIVDNAPPSVSITPSWWIWETADAAVYEQIIPLGSISITVECGDLPDRTYDYNPNRGPFTFNWDRRCGDGTSAASGTYSVVLRACDIYANCASARGKVEIPFIALVPATSTPMPTLQPTQAGIWYQTPTPVPSQTPTVQPTLVFPVLPAIGGEDGDNKTSQSPDQPLLPLAAAALGASVLLAAASRREEKETLAAEIRAAQEQASKVQQATDLSERQADVAAQTIATVNVEEPAIAVNTLSTLAGVVKTSFDGIWNEAVRISPADAPITIVTHNWVNGVDPIAYYRDNAEKLAAKALFWQNYNIASQKKYAEEQRLAAKAQEAAAKKASLEEEKQEQFGWTQAKLSGTVAAYQAKKVSENDTSSQVKAFRDGEAASNTSFAAYKDYHDKLTRMEALTNDKNVLPQPINTIPLPGLAASIPGIDYRGQSLFQPKGDLSQNKPLPKWMGEFALSMIPIIGDGWGVVRQVINLFTTGSMDSLDLILSLTGLVFDLPFDAGFAGDAAIATLKGFSAMIPIGPARDVLLNAIKQVIKNPDEIVDFAETANKLMNNSELLEVLVENPKALEAVLNAGPEAVEQLAKQGDEAVKLVDKFSGEGLDFIQKNNLTPQEITELSKLSSDSTEIADDVINKIGLDYKNHPLRIEYEQKVTELGKQLEEILQKNNGIVTEAEARALSEARTNLGIEYKKVTPGPLRDYIYELNIKRYSNPLGPDWESLMRKYDGDFKKIAEACTHPNSDINSLLSRFDEWIQQKDVDFLLDAELKILRGE